MNINLLMFDGIKRITASAGRYYINSHKGRMFLAQTLPRIKKAADIRDRYEKQGTHIPPFLIASVASQCNLRCAGCYARAGGACDTSRSVNELSAANWQKVFEEAASLGVSFVLLAGGEPFTRPDILEVAARNKKMIFPVFTNGTMLDDKNLELLDQNRNIIPVLSIEGEQEETDSRRGQGIYAKVNKGMEELKKRGVLFGASITVTSENISKVTSEDFIRKLRSQGCGLVFFVEYVPVSQGTEHLVLSDEQIDQLAGAAAELKASINDMAILSFPGDEAAMGGCLASGRGFFHINAAGGAEPCPFSPHAIHNIKTHSLLEIISSQYFKELREIAANAGEHQGGCTLFQEEAKVLGLRQEHGGH